MENMDTEIRKSSVFKDGADRTKAKPGEGSFMC